MVLDLDYDKAVSTSQLQHWQTPRHCTAQVGETTPPALVLRRQDKGLPPLDQAAARRRPDQLNAPVVILWTEDEVQLKRAQRLIAEDRAAVSAVETMAKLTAQYEAAQKDVAASKEAATSIPRTSSTWPRWLGSPTSKLS